MIENGQNFIRIGSWVIEDCSPLGFKVFHATTMNQLHFKADSNGWVSCRGIRAGQLIEWIMDGGGIISNEMMRPCFLDAEAALKDPRLVVAEEEKK